LSRQKKSTPKPDSPVTPKPASPENIAVGRLQVEHSQFSGPIPPPEFLARYDAVLPGLADRIVRMAENQANHRHSLESLAIKAEINRSYLGIASGLLVALTGIGSGAILIYHDKIVAGSVFAGATLVSLVGVFVYGARTRRKEREAKTRILAGE